MGQCFSEDNAYERTEYKYQCYDWLGDREKETFKGTDKGSNKGTDKPEHIQPSVDIKVFAIAGTNNSNTVVQYSTDIHEKDNVSHISVSIIMGQCTSAQRKGNSIEEEPYRVAKRREPEPREKYHSGYTPYKWDIYVDAYNPQHKSNLKRDRARSYNSLRWDIQYEDPKPARRKSVDAERGVARNSPDHLTSKLDTPDDDVTLLKPVYNKSDETPFETSTKAYKPPIDKSTKTYEQPVDTSTKPDKHLHNGFVESDVDSDDDIISVKELIIPHDNAPVFEQANRNIPDKTYTEPVIRQTIRSIPDETTREPIYDQANRHKDNNPYRSFSSEPVYDQPDGSLPDKTSGELASKQVNKKKPDTSPNEPVYEQKHGSIPDKTHSEPIYTQVNKNKPVKSLSEPVYEKANTNKPTEPPVNKPFTERIEDDYPRRRIAEKQFTGTPEEETPRKDVAAQNNKNYNDDIRDEQLKRKDAPPRYSDVVPNSVHVVKNDNVLPRGNVNHPDDKNCTNKQKPDSEPDYQGLRNSLQEPIKSADLDDLREKRSPELPRNVTGCNDGVKDKIDADNGNKPGNLKRLNTITTYKPHTLHKKPDEPVVTTAVISPRRLSCDDLGTRPEKNAVKATVLIPQKFPQLFTGKRHAWRGLLLFGPSGSGKASLATAVAKEIGHSYSTLRNFKSLNTNSGNAVPAMFKRARENTPHVIIIDHLEILSAAEIRELHKEMTSSTEEETDGLLVVGISDSPWLLDKALVELFEKRIYITLPSAASRVELFRENLQESQLSLSEEDFIELGAWSEGYSCADIITVVNETRMRSLRKIQDASYFKKVPSTDPVTGRYIDLYTPCSPGEIGAIEMDWTRIAENKLQEPVIRLCDVLVALRIQKPSLSPDDINKHKQFAKKFTQHLVPSTTA